MPTMQLIEMHSISPHTLKSMQYQCKQTYIPSWVDNVLLVTFHCQLCLSSHQTAPT